MAKEKTGLFVADVSTLNLDKEALQEIDQGIQKVVLGALSRNKPKVDGKLFSWRLTDWRRWGGGTLGIWIGDRDLDGIPDNMDMDDFRL